MTGRNDEDGVEMSALSSFKTDNSTKTPMRTMIAAIDPANQNVKSELSDMVLLKFKCEKNDVPITVTNGSTLPLVERPNDEEAALYNPFEHRKIAKPTSDLDTLIHLLKGSLGTGILAMPLAFKHAGLYFGLVATCFIGLICTYCVHILVKCSHTLCRRTKTPSLGFAEVAEAAFLVGPEPVQKYARLAKAMINTFLVIDLLGCCCVYIVFVARNLEQVVSYYTHEGKVTEAESEVYVKYYMVGMLPLLIVLGVIRNLKLLTPFSMLANILIATGMGITFYYLFDELKPVDSIPKMAEWNEIPSFFGMAIFALEGIGVVMPLENNMKTPNHFIGCPGVLNTGMAFVVALYSTFGFFGYLRYGADIKGSVTLNLPDKYILAQSVKVMIAIAILFTYGLQFYVPMEIIWKNVKGYFGSRKLTAEYCIRVGLVVFTVVTAILIPQLGPFISLIGAICLSTLGLMFPSVIELVTVWESENGLGKWNWILWKNIAIIAFGILGFITGSYVSVLEIIGPVEEK